MSANGKLASFVSYRQSTGRSETYFFIERSGASQIKKLQSGEDLFQQVKIQTCFNMPPKQTFWRLPSGEQY